jgi:hypothetical protein
MGIKQPGCEVDHPSQSSVEFNLYLLVFKSQCSCLYPELLSFQRSIPALEWDSVFHFIHKVLCLVRRMHTIWPVKVMNAWSCTSTVYAFMVFI